MYLYCSYQTTCILKDIRKMLNIFKGLKNVQKMSFNKKMISNTIPRLSSIKYFSDIIFKRFMRDLYFYINNSYLQDQTWKYTM
jgi:hypothetical protein